MKYLALAATILATAAAADVTRAVGPYTVTVGEESATNQTELSLTVGEVVCTGNDKLVLGVSRFTKEALPEGYSPFTPSDPTLHDDGISMTAVAPTSGPLQVPNSNAQLGHWHLHAACARESGDITDHHSAPFSTVPDALGSTVPIYVADGRTMAWLHRSQGDQVDAAIVMPLGLDLGDMRDFDGVTDVINLSVRALGGEALHGACTSTVEQAGPALPRVLAGTTAPVSYASSNARLSVYAAETFMRAGELLGRTLVFSGKGSDNQPRHTCVPLSNQAAREYRTRENTRVAVAEGASSGEAFGTIIEQRRTGTEWSPASVWMSVDSAAAGEYTYHVHVAKPGNIAMPGACHATYTGGHLDPTFQGMSSKEEVGNLSGRHGLASRTGVVRATDNMVTLAYDSLNSVLGRSIVLHEAVSGDRRVCGPLVSTEDAALGIDDKHTVSVIKSVPADDPVAMFEIAQVGRDTAPYVSMKINKADGSGGAWVAPFTLDTPERCMRYGGYISGYANTQVGSKPAGMLTKHLDMNGSEVWMANTDLTSAPGHTIVMQAARESGVARTCVVLTGDGVAVPEGLTADREAVVVTLENVRGKLTNAEAENLRTAVLAVARGVAAEGANVQARVMHQNLGYTTVDGQSKEKVEVEVFVSGVDKGALLTALQADTTVQALVPATNVKGGVWVGRCADGLQNGGETGVDCGGASGCGLCGNDVGCVDDHDCLAGVCVKNKCREGNGNAAITLGAGVAMLAAAAAAFLAF